MKREPITTEQVLDALARTVEKYGEGTTYRTRREGQGLPADYGRPCLYVHQDPTAGEKQPGCIIGVILHEEFGVSLDALATNERRGANHVLIDGEWAFESRAGRVARQAQRVQDVGGTWGQALERARDWAVGGAA